MQVADANRGGRTGPGGKGSLRRAPGQPLAWLVVHSSLAVLSGCQHEVAATEPGSSPSSVPAAASALPELVGARVVVAADAGIFYEGIVDEASDRELRFGPGVSPGAGWVPRERARALDPGAPPGLPDAGALGACRTRASEWLACQIIGPDGDGVLAQASDGSQPTVSADSFVPFDSPVDTEIRAALAAEQRALGWRRRLAGARPAPTAGLRITAGMKLLVRYDQAWVEGLLVETQVRGPGEPDAGARSFTVQWNLPRLSPSQRDAVDMAPLPRLPPKLQPGDLVLHRVSPARWEPFEVQRVQEDQVWLVAPGSAPLQAKLDTALLKLETAD